MDGMLPMSQAELEAVMPYIMERMRETRRTYSDTPGMGNVPERSIMGPFGQFMGAPRPGQNWHREVPPGLTPEQRMAWEYAVDNAESLSLQEHLKGLRGGMLPVGQDWGDTIMRGLRGIARPIPKMPPAQPQATPDGKKPAPRPKRPNNYSGGGVRG